MLLFGRREIGNVFTNVTIGICQYFFNVMDEMVCFSLFYLQVCNNYFSLHKFLWNA